MVVTAGKQQYDAYRWMPKPGMSTWPGTLAWPGKNRLRQDFILLIVDNFGEIPRWAEPDLKAVMYSMRFGSIRFPGATDSQDSIRFD